MKNKNLEKAIKLQLAIDRGTLQRPKGYTDPLAYWYQLFCIEHIDLEDTVLQDYLDWEEEDLDDFYSWGHNSRWANTFTSLMIDNLDWYIDQARNLAEEYGDIKEFDYKEN